MSRRKSRLACLLPFLMIAGLASAPASEPPLRMESTHGTVISVDPTGGMFVLRPEKGGEDEITLHVDAHTKVFRDGHPVEFTEVTADAYVTVNYERAEDGRLVALTIGLDVK